MQGMITKQEVNCKKLEKDSDAALVKARHLQFRRNADRNGKEENEKNDDFLTPSSINDSRPYRRRTGGDWTHTGTQGGCLLAPQHQSCKKKIKDEKIQYCLEENDP